MIAIAHRLTMLSRVNRLVVLDRGHILATGTHQQLMKARGRYWAMVQAQRVLAESRMLSTIQDVRSQKIPWLLTAWTVVTVMSHT